MIYDEFCALINASPAPGGHKALCPAHNDRNPSLSLTAGREGILLKCWAGCEWDDILRALRLPLNSLFYDTSKSFGRVAPQQPEGMWSYLDADGTFLYQVLKYRSEDGSKYFKQRRYKPESAESDEQGWVWNLKGTKRVLYRLPEVVQSSTYNRIWIVDGEKDADEHAKHGQIATCAPGGANKWLASYVKYFLNKRVIIVRDKGESNGEAYCEDIRESLEGISKWTKVVEAKFGKDSYDTLQKYPIEEAFVSV